MEWMAWQDAGVRWFDPAGMQLEIDLAGASLHPSIPSSHQLQLDATTHLVHRSTWKPLHCGLIHQILPSGSD